MKTEIRGLYWKCKEIKKASEVMELLLRAEQEEARQFMEVYRRAAPAADENVRMGAGYFLDLKGIQLKVFLDKVGVATVGQVGYDLERKAFSKDLTKLLALCGKVVSEGERGSSASERKANQRYNVALGAFIRRWGPKE